VFVDEFFVNLSIASGRVWYDITKQRKRIDRKISKDLIRTITFYDSQKSTEFEIDESKKRCLSSISTETSLVPMFEIIQGKKQSLQVVIFFLFLFFFILILLCFSESFWIGL
jgi:hypothetical protein